MAARASLLADGDETVHRSRHRATHEQQVPLGVHLHDPEAELREAPRAHVTRHPLSFDDPGRIRPRRDGSGLAVAGVAVGLGAAAEMVAMHHALEAPAFGHTGHLYDVPRLEDRHRDRLPRLGRSAVARHRKALQHAGRRLEARPLHVSEQRFGGALRLLRAEAQLDCGPRQLHHGARARLDHRHGDVRPPLVEEPRHPELPADHAVHAPRYSTLISTSTPAGKSSFVNASTVCERESRMSISRLCVLSSNCSRLFLSMCGLRSTVHSCRLVGSGIGPETWAPVFSAVRTMSAAAWSMSAWSNALRRMRILPAIRYLDSSLLPDLRGDSRAHRPATLADREAEAFLHRDRRDQLDRHLRIVARHH